MAEPSHVAFCLCSLPCYALLAPNVSASFFPLPEPSPTMPFFVPWLSSLPPGNLHGFPLVICTLSAPSRGEIYLQHNPVIIAYSYFGGWRRGQCSFVVVAEKWRLDKQFLKISFVIVLLPVGPEYSSPVALFGHFFTLHYIIVAHLSTLTGLSGFWKEREGGYICGTSVWQWGLVHRRYSVVIWSWNNTVFSALELSFSCD